MALQHRESTGKGVTLTRLSGPAQPVSNVLTWKFISLSYNIPNHKIRGLIKSQGSCQSPMFWAFSFSKTLWRWAARRLGVWNVYFPYSFLSSRDPRPGHIKEWPGSAPVLWLAQSLSALGPVSMSLGGKNRETGKRNKTVLQQPQEGLTTPAK